MRSCAPELVPARLRTDSTQSSFGKCRRCGYARAMSDNVIKFQPRPKPQPPRQTPPWAKRLLVVLAIAAFFIAAYVYFALTGAAAGV